MVHSDRPFVLPLLRPWFATWVGIKSPTVTHEIPVSAFLLTATSLSRVAGPTGGLPVFAIPKQSMVATVWNDMVDLSGDRGPTEAADVVAFFG